jgi:beta-lactamase class A
MVIARTATLALAAVALTAAAAACSGVAPKPTASTSSSGPTASTTGTVSLPNTPAGVQAHWFFGAVAQLPMADAEVTAHFDKTFLAAVSPSQLNAALEKVKSLQLDSVTTATPSSLVMAATANGNVKLSVSLVVDSSGLISGLLLQAASTTPVPTSWAAVDRQIRSVAPQARLLVASVSGDTCRPIQSIGATTAAPLGSAFKLYVLDALARAVAAGRVGWNQKLTITSQVKSLPSGELQNDPDGTRVSVRQAAADMISLSDNTAADMLITLLGRASVEAAARETGMADSSRNVPFLTTRELFVLKLDDWPRLANRYLALGPAGRSALLAGTVDRVPLAALSAAGWTAPRDIDSLEWFATPTDICHVYASLAALARQPKLAPVASILQINDGGMNLNPSQWRSVWFKGGSEPGVLTLNYLATTRGGQTYLVSVLAENPAASINEASATPTLISAVKGAFQLAASPAAERALSSPKSRT